MGVLTLIKIGDRQFWKEKFHATNGKAHHALMMGPVFPFGGGLSYFCFFPLFAMCFQHVPNRFLSFQMCSQYVPNNTWVLSHMVCPKFNCSESNILIRLVCL